MSLHPTRLNIDVPIRALHEMREALDWSLYVQEFSRGPVQPNPNHDIARVIAGVILAVRPETAAEPEPESWTSF